MKKTVACLAWWAGQAFAADIDIQLHVMATGGARLQSSAGTGAAGGVAVAVGVPVGRFFTPELVLGTGYARGLHASINATDSTNRIAVGSRLFVPWLAESTTRPFLWTAFHHGHRVLIEDFQRAPIAVMSGSSEAGVQHLSFGAEVLTASFPRGKEVGVGVETQWQRDGVPPLLWNARAVWTWVPPLHGSSGMNMVTVDVGVGFALSL
jgi:hypothetical protein